MTTNYNPQIVTSGLVLAVDGANPKSYPGTGTTWNDLSGNGNTLTFSSSPIFDANNVFTFNTNYAATTNNVLNSAAYTKCAWFQTQTVTIPNNIISGRTSQHAFWLNSGNKLRSGHNGAFSAVVSNTSIVPNQWYFGAVSFNTGTGFKLYLNGALEVTSANTNPFIGTGDIEVAGYSGASNFFQGQITGVSIYNRVLSDDEIKQNFNTYRGRFGV
jgi:hypothetical protein